MKRLSLLCVLSVLLLGAGCAKQMANAPQMTPDEFYGKCIFPGGRDLCGDDQSICSDFQGLLTANYANLKECTEACNKMQMQETSQYVTQDCGAVIGGAADLCEQFCHRKYGK